ncbi:hypothetical protein C8046_02240 [Serinibacter arcticus]|uniref:DUF8091 domain-containing protein n=1 Tax=Serinibacter arcticus TaxID=1655435 RepID=A0A2U1ZRX2_9MICO|nr:hypothetical protein [Serinibacter arcticus]PWD49700.1 hypothetical protein C8046_02240 [Serinibacter arcticus]
MSIGELREGPLHAALKRELAAPDDAFEVRVGRWVIDLVRADGELVEVQTGSFAPLGDKLDGLLDTRRMRVVFPVPARRRVVRIDAGGAVLSERRSPRAGRPVDVFDRLVAFPTLIGHPNLVLEVVLCAEDHVRGAEPARSTSGRRRRDPGVRHLTAILERHEVRRPADLLTLLPGALPAGEFTTAELARALRLPLVLAQRVVFCLRHAGLLDGAGLRARAPLHRRAHDEH